MTSGTPDVLTAAQMLSVGTSLLSNHRQSPAATTPFPALSVCATDCVVGELPYGQPADEIRCEWVARRGARGKRRMREVRSTIRARACVILAQSRAKRCSDVKGSFCPHSGTLPEARGTWSRHPSDAGCGMGLDVQKCQSQCCRRASDTAGAAGQYAEFTEVTYCEVARQDHTREMCCCSTSGDSEGHLAEVGSTITTMRDQHAP
jgi:hypothetical protein